MSSLKINYLSSQYFTQKGLSASFLLLFLFATTLPLSAQQLVDPEKFDALLPEAIADSWNKSSFNIFSSQDENFGAASYIGPDNAIIQIGIRHYSADKWKQEKTKIKEDSKTKKVENYTLYFGKTMGQREVLLFLDNHFSIRVTGQENIVDKQISTIINAVSPDKILALASPQKSTSSSSEDDTPSESLKKLLPDHLAGMQHGRIIQQSSGSVISTTYGNDDLPYSVNIQLAKGELAQNYNKQLEDKFSEPNTDLQQIEHNSYKLFYRVEESAISYMSFYNNRLIVIGADAPAQTTFDLEEARSHLLNAYDELISGLK